MRCDNISRVVLSPLLISLPDQKVCAVCTNDYYPSGSFECLECSEGNAASALITIM